MRTASEIGLDLNTKRAELAKLFADHTKADGSYDFTGEQLGEVNARNDEISALAKEYEAAAALEAIDRNVKGALRPQPRLTSDGLPGEGPGTKAPHVRDLDEMLKGANYEAFQRGEIKTFRLSMTPAEVKTVITLSGIAPLADRQPQITGYPAAFTPIDDLLLDGTTTSNVVSYFEETGETDNTAARTEGSALTDNAFTFTERTDTVRPITSWIPSTVEALRDNAQLNSFITERLGYLIAKKRTDALLNGTGVAPQITGLLNRTNIQTQARGTDPAFDAIMKAITLVATTGDALATGVVINPTDWQNLRLARTADGLYILGSPSDAAPVRIWGLEPRVTPSIAAGTALVGAFKPYAQVFRRTGLDVVVSTEHSTYFTERKVAILAEEYLTLACYRGQAFCKVTGL